MSIKEKIEEMKIHHEEKKEERINNNYKTLFQ